uniref:Uncharacterized protein n=1 Tax=Octopus bimaculoides TaxID=37653 RepID=A0A0L8HHD0_OCTBM
MYVYVYMCVHKYIYIHMCVYVHMYVCIYVYIYTMGFFRFLSAIFSQKIFCQPGAIVEYTCQSCLTVKLNPKPCGFSLH